MSEANAKAHACAPQERISLCVPTKSTAWRNTVTAYKLCSHGGWNSEARGYKYTLYPVNADDFDKVQNKNVVYYCEAEEARKAAIVIHGSEEALEGALRRKEERVAKATATRAANAETRKKQLDDLAAECGLCFDAVQSYHSGRREAIFKMYNKYLSVPGETKPLDVVLELTKLKFLQKYTPYLRDIQAVGDVFDRSGSYFESMVLRGLGGYPGWWPWLQWTPVTAKFATPEYKERVKALLLSVNRLGWPPIIVEIILTNLAAVTVEGLCRNHRRPKSAEAEAEADADDQ